MIRSDKLTNNDKKKDYLNSYKKACCKLKSLEEQLKEIRESKSSAQGIAYSDMPKGTNQSDLSDYMVKVDKLLTKIEKIKKECLDIKLDIESRIADIEDGIECDVLRNYYIKGMTWEEVCVAIGYSWRQTHRIHSRALRNLNIT